jgi:hypothetical protein
VQALSTRVAALLAVAATLTLFAFVIAAQQHVQIGLTAQAGDVQALDADTDDDDSDDLVEQQQEEDEQNQQQQDEEQPNSRCSSPNNSPASSRVAPLPSAGMLAFVITSTPGQADVVQWQNISFPS